MDYLRDIPMMYVGDIKNHKVFVYFEKTERILAVECPNGYFFQYRLTPESFAEFPDVYLGNCDKGQYLENIFPKGITVCEFGACRPDRTPLLCDDDIYGPVYWDPKLFSELDYKKVGKILWSIDMLNDDILQLRQYVLKNTIDYGPST
jgi:hypothetical protein